MRIAKGNLTTGPSVRNAKLPLFLRKHFRLGNELNFKMEGRRFYNERKDRLGDTERDFDQHQGRQVLFYEFCVEREDLFNVVSCMAKRTHGSTYVSSRNVAMGSPMLWQ